MASLWCTVVSSPNYDSLPADIHTIDLAGHDVPWVSIGRLDRLEEISLWDTGLSGSISAAALCGLTALRVLAMSQNQLSGQIPDCASQLHRLQLLWLEQNRIQ